MNQLQNFAARALRLIPVALWWVLALLVGVVLSIGLEKELFPHTPAAKSVAYCVLMSGLLTLPALGAWWLWRVAASIEPVGWRLLWQVAAGGASVAAGLGTILLLILLTVLFEQRV